MKIKHISHYYRLKGHVNKNIIPEQWGSLGGANGKEPTCQCRRHKRLRFNPCLGRSPGGGHGHPLQYSCLENPMDRGAWQAMVHRVAKIENRTELI